MSINSSNDIKEFINKDHMVILYFTGFDCGACEVIKVKLKNILNKYPKIKFYEISGDIKPYISAEFGVFSLPIMILYVEGKETIRVGRNMSILDVERDICRYYNMIFK